MKVRCGSCRTEFDVPGAGRFACPVCGSVNVVRAAAGQQPPPQQQQPPPQQGMGGYPTAPGVAPGAGMTPPPPPPAPPEEPLPKVQCPECDFSFVVGMIAVATCPNCSAEVDTGIEEDQIE